jgi:thymidylate kinase
MSKIIAIEGPDRVGKKSQSKLLKDNLVRAGYRCALIEVPVSDNLTYSIIYWMLGNGLAKKLPKSFQWMQCLNRWIFQTFKLVNIEHNFDYIIFDRWSLSTVVYGAVEGLSASEIDTQYQLIRKPDITFIMLGDAHPHVAEDHYEADAELQENVRLVYANWAECNSDECIVLDCNQPQEDIANEIVQCLIECGIVPSDSDSEIEEDSLVH